MGSTPSINTRLAPCEPDCKWLFIELGPICVVVQLLKIIVQSSNLMVHLHYGAVTGSFVLVLNDLYTSHTLFDTGVATGSLALAAGVPVMGLSPPPPSPPAMMLTAPTNMIGDM